LTTLWPGDNFTIMHNGFYNDTGYLHYRVVTADQYPQAITDILRYEGTCIMEHWDVIQSWSQLTQIHWRCFRTIGLWEREE
jgi:predicted SnoaL-like aldol condensation-catalyzing enzyme